MSDLQFSLKELYSVSLKTTCPMEIKGKKIEEGETIAFFDRIQIANFNEIKEERTAHGGYQDAPRVFWETSKGIQINFTQGIFSQTQYALMSNAKLLLPKKEKVLISTRECVESDENCIITLSKEPKGKVFVYCKDGDKVGSIDSQGKRYKVDSPYMDCFVDYEYEYEKNSVEMIVGQSLTNGFLSLHGRTRVKDDITGQVKTGIIYIPKLKLMSNLSIQLGEKANPVVGRFSGMACPAGTRGNPVAMELFFLEDDIDSDF